MNAEDRITAWFASHTPLDPRRFPIGIGDDMAQVRVDGGTVLVTTDMLLDGTHFDRSRHSLEQIGFKAMNVNLSDCAAMATVPLCAVGATALPKDMGAEDLKRLHIGVARAGAAFDCPVVGGDITAWHGADRLAICLTVLSRPAEGVEPVRRDGARVGDAVCVTGALGGSGRGRHLSFVPRVHEAITLARRVRLHAMMDISDGLSSDLDRICAASHCGAVLEARRIPLSDEARRCDDPLAAALNEGEDFELLFTVAESEAAPLEAEGVGGLPVTRIGTIAAEPGIRIVMADGAVHALPPGGYDHLETRP